MHVYVHAYTLRRHGHWSGSTRRSASRWAQVPSWTCCSASSVWRYSLTTTPSLHPPSTAHARTAAESCLPLTPTPTATYVHTHPPTHPPTHPHTHTHRQTHTDTHTHTQTDTHTHITTFAATMRKRGGLRRAWQRASSLSRPCLFSLSLCVCRTRMPGTCNSIYGVSVLWKHTGAGD
jgi:hypothetical protein